MNRKLIVYDWKVIARDGDFRKYKKIYLLELDIDDMTFQIDTELYFGDTKKARVKKVIVDLVNNVEYYEAVAINDWNL